VVGGCPPAASFNLGGALGGLQAGYNWLLNRGILVGVETDLDWAGIRGTGTSNFVFGAFPPAPSNFVASQRIDWFGTIRGRLGYFPMDRLLAYATGGFAYGGIAENVALNTRAGNNLFTATAGFQCSFTTGSNCFLGNSVRVAPGWAAGGGIEYAMWNNVSVKAEYLFVSLDKDVVNVVAQSTGGSGTPASFSAAFSRPEFHVIRLGVNYKFGS
jgi:outer membrane immunogenic protein